MSETTPKPEPECASGDGCGPNAVGHEGQCAPIPSSEERIPQSFESTLEGVIERWWRDDHACYLSGIDGNDTHARECVNAGVKYGWNARDQLAQKEIADAIADEHERGYARAAAEAVAVEHSLEARIAASPSTDGYGDLSTVRPDVLAKVRQEVEERLEKDWTQGPTITAPTKAPRKKR